jgi:hypothetical protein
MGRQFCIQICVEGVATVAFASLLFVANLASALRPEGCETLITYDRSFEPVYSAVVSAQKSPFSALVLTT